MGTFRLIYGVEYELQNLNFDLFELEILKVNSLKFKQFFSKFKHPIHHIFLDVRDYYKSELGKTMFAIINYSDNTENDFSNNLLEALIVACPSNVHFTCVISFSKDNEEYFFCTSKTTIPIQTFNWDPRFIFFTLHCTKAHFKLFLNKYHESICNKELQFTISTYINSFNCNRADLCYLNLCMALESILEKAPEISYRLKRSIAVLCGETIESSRRISCNVEYIYDLRSRIIHGGNYTFEDILKYLEYLRLLVSNVIAELIKHGLSKKEFNKRILEIG